MNLFTPDAATACLATARDYTTAASNREICLGSSNSASSSPATIPPNPPCLNRQPNVANARARKSLPCSTGTAIIARKSRFDYHRIAVAGKGDGRDTPAKLETKLDQCYVMCILMMFLPSTDSSSRQEFMRISPSDFGMAS